MQTKRPKTGEKATTSPTRRPRQRREMGPVFAEAVNPEAARELQGKHSAFSDHAPPGVPADAGLRGGAGFGGGEGASPRPGQRRAPPNLTGSGLQV